MPLNELPTDIRNELKEVLNKVLAHQSCATGTPAPTPPGFDPEGDVIFDPESDVIFDPEGDVIFDPEDALNSPDGECIKHFSRDLFDGYGNRINKMKTFCGLVQLLRWLIRYYEYKIEDNLD